jgi:hypothetical protein
VLRDASRFARTRARLVSPSSRLGEFPTRSLLLLTTQMQLGHQVKVTRTKR